MLVFKRLDKEIRKNESMLADYRRDADASKLLTAKLNALKEIEAYLRDFKWLKHKKYIEKVKMYLDTDFDAAECARHYGYACVNTWETSMSYAANKFEESIGQNTLQIILRADSLDEVGSGLFQFRVRSGKLNLNQFLLSDVVKLLPEGNKGALFGVKDCKKELGFLKSASKNALLSKVCSLDREKLSFLVSVLEGKDYRYAGQRLHIYNYILGGVESFNELLWLLDEFEIDRNQPGVRLTI